jgi:hypothetical protein
LINSTELQALVITEFTRRFKDEYKLGTERGDSIEKKNNYNHINHVNQSNNLNLSQHINNLLIPSPRKKIPNAKNGSFTSELITKLISNKYLIFF